MVHFCHHTSVVDEKVMIGEGSKIWHFTHVCSGAKIGQKCVIGQNVFIGASVEIGDGCKIQNNVSLYNGVTLEDEVFCGPSVVFTNVINPRAFVERKDEFKETRICRGASLGANSTIICGVRVGEFALIGAGAVVTQDVPSFALVVGVPANRIGWVSKLGYRLDLPVRGRARIKCPGSGDNYELINDRLVAL